MARKMSLGNRIAPPHFLLFLALLAAGFVAGLELLSRAQAVMASFDIAAFVFLEKLLPGGRSTSRLAGVALIVVGVAFLAAGA